MMGTICALVLSLLCILQNVTGRPDFGLKGEVVGSMFVANRSTALSVGIGTLSDYKILLGSQYQVLYRMRDAFYSVADNFTKPGAEITDQLAYLASNRSVMVDFQTTLAAIASLQTVLTTGYTQEYVTLQPRNQSFITDRLTDSFAYINQTLVQLDKTLRQLQTAAAKAQQEAGSNGQTIDMKIVREFISPRLINTLLNAIDQLPGAISPLVYSVHSPLAQLDKADSYISTAKGDIESALLQAHQEVVNFNGNIRQLKQETNDVIATISTAYRDQQTLSVDLLPKLKASVNYQYDLKMALDTFVDVASVPSIEEKTGLLNQTIANYVSNSTTYDDDLVTVYGDRICPAMQAVVQVLIASGPYAAYCYNKYSHRVVDLAIHNFYDIGECYQLELNRLYSVSRLISNLISLVTFNFADLFENLSVCAAIQSCPGDCDPCVDTLGRFLDTLALLMEEKYDLILQIVPYEAKASLQRVKSCAAFSKYKLIADAHDLIKEVYDCEVKGYK
ncbi:uncharacterized protein LOC121597449 [Anopheles merus]|uniref:uncharacterized protein LOC121597449 n=1 Tax=Anopheles merus TaxID=30066 RepID=UPI001BE43A5C|nr:uncharacterized protein LOC121597449 [Anopheles merus]